MNHPQITEWADYVRAVITTAEREALERHLETGCTLCQATLTAIERVAEIAAIDLASEPPNGLLRSVKAFFSVQSGSRHGHWTELRLRSAFDSLLSPAPAGSRGPGEISRQLVFESDRYTVELSLDLDRESAETVVRGQILEAHGQPRSHTPVFLVSDGEVLGRAISEQHGDFEMTGHLVQPCELWVFPDDESRIRLPLGSDP